MQTNQGELTLNLNGLPRFVVVVQFINGVNTKHYDFWCSQPVKHNDILVVDTVNGLQLAKVVGIKTESSRATKWVVDKVDTSAYEMRMLAEKKQQKIRQALEKRAKQADELIRYRALATVDPEIAKLLTELEQTNKQLETFVWDASGRSISMIE